MEGARGAGGCARRGEGVGMRGEWKGELPLLVLLLLLRGARVKDGRWSVTGGSFRVNGLAYTRSFHICGLSML